jgi:hypothetical protein
MTVPTGPLEAELVWQNHVQQDHGKNPNGTGNDKVRDKVRDKVGHVPWNAQFRRCKTGRFEITAWRVATPSRRAVGVRLAEREFRRKQS